MSTAKKWIFTAAVLSAILTIWGFACTINVAPPSGDGGGSQTAGGGSTTPPDTTPDEPNPNSPCSDGTNIHVTYVNESSAVVNFVEAFTDQAGASVSAKMVVLGAAGETPATASKCIPCPYRAAVRNISFTENGTERIPVGPELTRGQFKCGDNITFVFKPDHSITVAAATP